MQAISGLFFSLSLVLAVVLGGQTLDYTWGPALVALAISLATGALQLWQLGKQPKSAWFAFIIILVASGWILWGCWGSPVTEFGRSDALLVVAALTSCLWAWTMPTRGVAIRFSVAALALLGFANLALVLIQLRDPAFAWPFAFRPVQLPSGLFGHYNHLADFSQVSALILAARALWARDSLAERIVHALGALAAVACVALCGSRGGALSLGVGVAVLCLCLALLAWRDKKRNRGIIIGTAVAVPVLIVLLAPLVFSKIQQRRGAKDPKEITQVADDRFRLTLAGYAIKISTTQPWTGSGSRSFGWKKNAVANPDEDKLWDRFNDDFVHNELLQAAVDYGWGGALLIVAAVLTTGLTGVAGLAGRDEADAGRRGALDAMVCGGLAAMTGTLCHSNFSFVSHTLPGAMYLGLAFGFALPRRELLGEFPSTAGRLVPCLIVVPLSIVLALTGWRASQTFRTLWPVSFGREFLGAAAPALAVEHVQHAMELWPGAELAGKGGQFSRNAAAAKGLPKSEQDAWLTQAVDFYTTAIRLNPYDPEWPVNRGNMLSALDRDNEAERDFERAIVLEGGTERNFRARFCFASHLYRRWYDAWTKERRAGEAMGQFIRARDLLREADQQGGLGQLGKDGQELVKSIEDTIRFLEGAHVQPEPVR
ncbi:O-antigen ligase family protein [Luteolibacter soli]|uniref:O-antigen ligase family protein n=1 Tax=Luteolibacter soli TaxID=3135280 RepID=A0ABU9AU00_9BACT